MNVLDTTVGTARRPNRPAAPCPDVKDFTDATSAIRRCGQSSGTRLMCTLSAAAGRCERGVFGGRKVGRNMEVLSIVRHLLDAANVGS